ncbi:MAG: hypothetical protein NT090_03080 [Acidobacteria bacterium]|nr:hypothetical protein [Acidobacteriota bacterium]
MLDIRADPLIHQAFEPLVGHDLAAKLRHAFLLVVIPKGGMPVVAQLTMIPEQLRVGGSINSGVIRASDALDVRTAKYPVAATPVDGTLLFCVPLKKSLVLDPSTRLELSVKDIRESESAARQPMGDWLQRQQFFHWRHPLRRPATTGRSYLSDAHPPSFEVT